MVIANFSIVIANTKIITMMVVLRVLEEGLDCSEIFLDITSPITSMSKLLLFGFSNLTNV